MKILKQRQNNQRRKLQLQLKLLSTISSMDNNLEKLSKEIEKEKLILQKL